MLSFAKSCHAGKILLQILFFLSSQVLAQSPIISVTPETLSENLFTAKTTTQKLKISNSGSGNLIFNISTKFSPGGNHQNFALKFDGVDDYIYCNNNSSFDIEAEITISAWIYIDTLPGQYMIIVDKGEQWSLFIDENAHLCSDHQGINPVRITSDSALSSGMWYHLVDTYDGTTRKLFINSFQNAFQVTSGSISLDSGPFLIGTDSPWLYSFFRGKIDEISIWDRALSELEIKANMNRGFTGREIGLVGYWNFDEGSGNIAYDKSLNANHGELRGGADWILSEIKIAPSWISASSDSGVCNPGSTSEVDVLLNAWGLRGGIYDAEITISSNDPVNPEIAIPVHLNVTDAPAFSVNIDSIDFGEVFLGVTDTIYLEVRNIGSQDLLVFGTSIQPTVYNVHPKFAGIDIGDNEIFTITFFPQSVDAYNGTITFNNNDPTLNSYIIPINGIGIEPPIINTNPDSLVISVLPGATKTHLLTIHNQGPSNLYFDIYGGFSSSNYALQFDGVNDYVKIVDVELNYSQLTLEAWTYLNTISPIHEVIDNIDGDFQLEIWEDGSIMFDAVGDWTRLVSSSNTMPLNQWVHLACTYDGVASSIFVNGNLVATGNFSGSVNRPNTIIHIGTETNNSDQFWDGRIDEVRIWSIAHTKAEIEECKSQQLTGIEPNLIGYWQFNEGVGNSAKDKTVNANNGILQGGVTWINSSAPMEPGWFTINVDSGICSANSSMDIELLFDATELDTGDYFATLIIKSNDPIKPLVTIPIHMIVSSTVGIDGEDNIPTVFNLNQNYPNPFNPSTKIKYSIPKESKVNLIVFNLLGEEVTTLVNEEQPEGNYSVEFNATNLPSGVYFYRIHAGNFIDTKKMLLLK